MGATIDILYQWSQLMLVASTILMLYQFGRGLSVFDHVVAVEAISLAVVGYLLLESNATEGRLYTSAALGLALFSFVGTVFLGYFLGRGEFPDE